MVSDRDALDSYIVGNCMPGTACNCSFKAPGLAHAECSACIPSFARSMACKMLLLIIAASPCVRHTQHDGTCSALHGCTLSKFQSFSNYRMHAHANLTSGGRHPPCAPLASCSKPALPSRHLHLCSASIIRPDSGAKRESTRASRNCTTVLCAIPGL